VSDASWVTTWYYPLRVCATIILPLLLLLHVHPKSPLSVLFCVCVCVCVQVAAAEQQLNDLMVSLQQELSGACIKFSQHRIFGVFLITNARQVGLYYF